MSPSATATIQPQFRMIDALKIRYADTDGSQEATLLLTSPWPESLYAFAPMWATLAKHARLLAIDLPGFGASERRDDLLSPRAMGDFLVRVIDDAELGKPHIVAPDVGTAAALFAAATNPDKISSVIVGTGGAAVPLQLGEPLRSWVLDPDLETYRRMDPRAIVNTAADTIAGGIPDKIRADYLDCYDGDRFVESMRYVRRYPEELPALAELLPEIATPVTIINGRHDRVVPLANAEFLDERLPDSRPRDHRCRPLRVGGGAGGVCVDRPRLADVNGPHEMAVIARTSHNTAETRFVSAAAGRRLRASRSAKEGAQHFDLIVFVRPGHKRTAKSPYLRGFSSKRLGHGFGPRVHFSRPIRQHHLPICRHFRKRERRDSNPRPPA
jgi:pimeloyl-ACP methyl ester carboxylesterase